MLRGKINDNVCVFFCTDYKNSVSFENQSSVSKVRGVNIDITAFFLFKHTCLHTQVIWIENVKASGLNFSGKETFLCISSSFPMLMLEVLKYLKPCPSLRDMLNVRYGTIKMLFFIDKPYSFIPLVIHIPWRDSVLHQGETFI